MFLKSKSYWISSWILTQLIKALFHHLFTKERFSVLDWQVLKKDGKYSLRLVFLCAKWNIKKSTHCKSMNFTLMLLNNGRYHKSHFYETTLYIEQTCSIHQGMLALTSFSINLKKRHSVCIAYATYLEIFHLKYKLTDRVQWRATRVAAEKSHPAS